MKWRALGILCAMLGGAMLGAAVASDHGMSLLWLLLAIGYIGLGAFAVLWGE
jgi:hypothetical protein